MSTSRFISYLSSYDVFGEPVSLNYKGDSHFRTWIGAVVTITIKSFLLIYGLLMMISLFGY